MNHDLALALCVMCGVFGGVMLLAFLSAFSSLNVFARSIEITKQRKKGFLWWYFLSGLFADWQIWKETKGIRWLIALGLILCLISFGIYHLYLAHA